MNTPQNFETSPHMAEHEAHKKVEGSIVTIIRNPEVYIKRVYITRAQIV